MVGSEGHDLHDSGGRHPASERLGQQGSPDAICALVLGYDEPPDRVDRVVVVREQEAGSKTAEIISYEESGAPLDVAVDRILKAGVVDHGTKQVLHFRRELTKCVKVAFNGGSDLHMSSLPAPKRSDRFSRVPSTNAGRRSRCQIRGPLSLPEMIRWNTSLKFPRSFP
jgi:hypothetical protein